MDSGALSVIINLISGAVGGNVAGAVMKDESPGPLGNSVAGILGGGGVGGAVALLVVALVKGLLGKK